MQEPESISPEGEGLQDDFSAADEVQPYRRSTRIKDPVAQGLKIAIVLVIIVWLVSMISAMMWGLLSPPTAPRTSAERDLMLYGATIQSGKTPTKTYAQYIGALINAGQLAKAQEALDQALKTAKTDRSYLYSGQAELSLQQKDYPATIVAADKAMAEAKKELKAYKDANVAAKRAPGAGAVMPTSYADAALAKAEALLASKDYAGAIKALDVYIKERPTDSDILVQRAEAKVLVGDKAGAAADYRAALLYIPDFQPALAGLKKIGAAR
ncbi:MAG: hypothetical protein WCP28_16260 [Actinomycetes bacterium]